ncbi:MAG: hypothetical protein WAL63_17800 [Solirubrobacteraceae bacterium]
MKSFLRFVPLGPRGRTSLLAAGAVLMLAIPASASAAAFSAHLKAPNHTPTANRKWPITVTATRGNAELSGNVKYQFLFQGQSVASRPGHTFTHGVFRDTLVFPGASIGHTLTLRVIVSTRYGTADLNWAVTTRR